MKFTSAILLATVLILVAGMLCSNMILKKEYDKTDKSDLYWTYRKVLQQPFKYLKITGGNISTIAFEQSPDCSVRILEDWARYHKGHVKASVTNDTLLLNFDFVPESTFEKYWMRNFTAVRIFAPQLLSVEGYDTNFEMMKMKQGSYTVRLGGKSRFEVESMQQNLDSLDIEQSDSSAVVFEMSPGFNALTEPGTRSATAAGGPSSGKVNSTPAGPGIKGNESMTLQHLRANVQGYSLLDIGHAQIRSLQLTIADSSAIILSGAALNTLRGLPGSH